MQPIVKWVGGKQRLLPQLEPLYPKDIAERRHVELFAGGAAMFFAREPARALLFDSNPWLINAYWAIRDDVDAVIAHLKILANEYARDALTAYASARELYNRKTHGPLAMEALPLESATELAALFLYLNRTCFNGVYRVNSDGKFNVPPGKYANPDIVNEDRLRAAAKLLGHKVIDVACEDFRIAVNELVTTDFVYVDPPYVPQPGSSGFTSYTDSGFKIRDFVDLVSICKQLRDSGCKVMVSHADEPFVRTVFDGWHITEVQAARAVNSKGSGRGKVAELVIRSYTE